MEPKLSLKLPKNVKFLFSSYCQRDFRYYYLFPIKNNFEIDQVNCAKLIYSHLKIFNPKKYSPLKNIHPRKFSSLKISTIFLAKEQMAKKKNLFSPVKFAAVAVVVND